MTKQPEQILEYNLIVQLAVLGYQQVNIKSEKELIDNLKVQLEKHNKVQLSDNDFKQILNFINKGNIFQRAKILRDRVPYTNDQGEQKTVELFNQIHWCQNEFQVTNQVTMEGKYKNRYDVTILINGLPLIQIELKRRGLELKEAFKQIKRYGKHTFAAGQGIFQFIQLFVISNGVDTKYFANGALKDRDFKQTIFWSDVDNKKIKQLSDFADNFLERCHVSKMISKYIVLNETQRKLMVLRPYQFYATEAIVERVKTTTKFGYIWHTTGSGKTLTSFKTAQLLCQLPIVHKVVFVVDRRDLDDQTTREFNSFSKGSIDGTNNTKALVAQLAGDHNMIVTTIQKLNTAVKKTRYLKQIDHLRDERIVFIFDECHRSQFGKTHGKLKSFFRGSQMFGFTGTPIFEKNAGTNEFGKRTTSMLFERCLHKYVITDAIRDDKVLKFSIEYIRTFRKKDNIVDINVEAIDEAEVMHAPERLNNIVDYIIANHNRKTHNRKFNAIFCVPSVAVLIEYYQYFLQKKEEGAHDLNLATIFSYGANEADLTITGNYIQSTVPRNAAEDFGFEEEDDEINSLHSREYLDAFIESYNQQFNTSFSTKDSQSFYLYYKDVAKRVKSQEVDLLLVVNMFLTGFDSKHLNTLYVDKNLKHHGLIQAYSRTNRILKEVKSQGNIVAFRNLKAATDDAIALFSNKDAKDEIIIAPYEDFVAQFNEAFIALMHIAPTVNSVDDLANEEEDFDFIRAFRALMRLKNVLTTFTQFDYEDLSMDEQLFEDYKSKYLDIYDRVRSDRQKEKVSILADIDFELELIHRDKINVTYIMKLLLKLHGASEAEREKQIKAISDLMAGETQLRSKRELIEKFIAEHLPLLTEEDEVTEAFEIFWNAESKKSLRQLSKEEHLDADLLEKIIGEFLFTEKIPLRDEVVGMMTIRPKLKERATVAERITQRILDFVETFINGVDI